MLGLLIVVLMNMLLMELALRTGELGLRDEADAETMKVWGKRPAVSVYLSSPGSVTGVSTILKIILCFD
jgi:hypothetical protein